MALNSLANVSGAGLPGGAGGASEDFDVLAGAVAELQRMRVTVVAGAGANTNIAVAGIVMADTLLSVLRHIDSGAATTASVVDHTAQAAITSDGNIQVTVATNINAGDRLVVTWFDKAA
jgi:hypothetical protein